MSKLRVLIGEDRDLVAARLVAQLDSLGHDIAGVVANGGEAVATALRLQPDLVLLDLRLPALNGIDAAREILALRPIPVILLCGYCGADVVRQAQEVGILAHLTWPADANALGSVIRDSLARFREFQVLCAQTQDLKQAARARLVVERAKKLLMRRLKLVESDAFRYLRAHGLSTGTPVWAVAANLLTAEKLLLGKPDLAECVDIVLDVLARRQMSKPTPVV